MAREPEAETVEQVRAVEEREAHPAPRPAELAMGLFFQAVEQAPVAISITDQQARILYANPAFQRVTGYSLQEAEGRNESILSDRCTPAIVYESLWASLVRQRPWMGRLVNRRKDGTRYLAELSASPVVDEAGTTTNFLGIHRDITEQHRLSREVVSQRELISALLDNAPTLVAALEPDGSIAMSNAAFRVASEEFGGEQRLATALQTALFGECKRLIPEEAPAVANKEVELLFERREEVRSYTCSANWLKADDGSVDSFFRADGRQFFLVFASEITAVRRRHDELRMNALRALMAEEEQRQNLRETLNGSIFQFEMPMNLLETAIGLVETRTPLSPDDEALLDALREVLARGNEAIELLRDSLPEAPPEAWSPVDLNQVLHDVIRLDAQRLMSEDVLVNWKPQDLPPLPARERRVRAMVKQLLDNAIEALPASGERDVTIEAHAEDDRIVLSFSDTGPGIPEELRLRVFEPFFTLGKPKRDGAGLGLSLVQEVVSEHHGVVYVDATYQRGCRMVIEFPLRTPE